MDDMMKADYDRILAMLRIRDYLRARLGKHSHEAETVSEWLEEHEGDVPTYVIDQIYGEAEADPIQTKYYDED